MNQLKLALANRALELDEVIPAYHDTLIHRNPTHNRSNYSNSSGSLRSSLSKEEFDDIRSRERLLSKTKRLEDITASELNISEEKRLTRRIFGPKDKITSNYLLENIRTKMELISMTADELVGLLLSNSNDTMDFRIPIESLKRVFQQELLVNISEHDAVVLLKEYGDRDAKVSIQQLLKDMGLWRDHFEKYHPMRISTEEMTKHSKVKESTRTSEEQWKKEIGHLQNKSEDIVKALKELDSLDSKGASILFQSSDNNDSNAVVEKKITENRDEVYDNQRLDLLKTENEKMRSMLESLKESKARALSGSGSKALHSKVEGDVRHVDDKELKTVDILENVEIAAEALRHAHAYTYAPGGKLSKYNQTVQNEHIGGTLAKSLPFKYFEDQGIVTYSQFFIILFFLISSPFGNLTIFYRHTCT